MVEGPIITLVRSMILIPAGDLLLWGRWFLSRNARSMACSQCLGESLEDLAAGLAALVDVLHPVFRDALEGRIEYLFVVGAEFDDLHALRLDLFGRGLLAVLEALAALAR